MVTNGVNGIDEIVNPNSDVSALRPTDVPRLEDTSLIQETMSSGPGAVEGDRRSRSSAAGAQDGGFPSADHAQQVMSPSRVNIDALRNYGETGFRGSSSSMAATYNIAGDSEDELIAMERSTFEDLLSQFTTSQGEAGYARRGDRETIFSYNT